MPNPTMPRKTRRTSPLAGVYPPDKTACLARAFSGSYLLVILLSSDAVISFGAAGKRTLRSGFYVYAGSALGSMGWRLLRHLGILKRRSRWHIDYLLGSEYADVVAVGLLPTQVRMECMLSSRVGSLAKESLAGIGSTDCKCNTHLHYFKTRADAVTAVRKALNNAAQKRKHR